MKKIMMIAAILIAIIVFGTNVYAQPPQGSPDGGGKGDKIESLRIAFISQRLNLTPEEAQKFWPVYNQYHTDIKSLRNNFGMGPGKPQLTADQSIDFDQKKLDLRKKYKAQFEAVLGKEKVNILYNLEEEFKQKLKELRDERQQKRGQGPPPGGKF